MYYQRVNFFFNVYCRKYFSSLKKKGLLKVKSETINLNRTQKEQCDEKEKSRGLKQTPLTTEATYICTRCEERQINADTKWTFLEHKGPLFAPPHTPLPSHIKLIYDGKEIKLSYPAEEVAGFYAKMLDLEYTSKKTFNANFFADWQKTMSDKERAIITDLKKCNFQKLYNYFKELSKKNKNCSRDEKENIKWKKTKIEEEFGFCIIDGHKEKINNFMIEPPGLYRGRGEHPKMGKLKKRVEAEDVIINCSKNSKIPRPPLGHRWKEVLHDPNVTWLASWTDNVQNKVKYIMMNSSSKLKSKLDLQKYEMARKLHALIDYIRTQYQNNWESKDMRLKQLAVALYFIDKLALRAGNEKGEDQADTVGCCSLRVEHIQLYEKNQNKDYVVIFNFLGKDCIRYYNEVEVEKRVFMNLQLFRENKHPGDNLFDQLNIQIMNKYLNGLMKGLTAKVFRTYHASRTLQQQLQELTKTADSIERKVVSYTKANRAVAILCNHQKSVSKCYQISLKKLKDKIEQKQKQISETQQQIKHAECNFTHEKPIHRNIYEKKKSELQKMKDQLEKLQIQKITKCENKTIDLNTSKLNYLDPRITVAWCKKYEVPIKKVYNKTQINRFQWAIQTTDPEYQF